MLTLQAFASLAQLGAGIGLALSVFLEPLRRSELALLRRFEDDLKTIADPKEPRGRAEKNLILGAKLDILSTAARLNRAERWPMRFVGAGAGLNFLTLLAATLWPETSVEHLKYVLTFLLLGPFLIGWIWLVFLKAIHFDSRANQYERDRLAL